mmetsp:Transcript_84007/g.271529  ORF Transcript_84007/g.271529 Transcript_84007/m.271529 type:complete len:220 (-) Transcript_84007:1037-1696(-)
MHGAKSFATSAFRRPLRGAARAARASGGGARARGRRRNAVEPQRGLKQRSVRGKGLEGGDPVAKTGEHDRAGAYVGADVQHAAAGAADVGVGQELRQLLAGLPSPAHLDLPIHLVPPCADAERERRCRSHPVQPRGMRAGRADAEAEEIAALRHMHHVKDRPCSHEAVAERSFGQTAFDSSMQHHPGVNGQAVGGIPGLKMDVELLPPKTQDGLHRHAG